ncbi:hypothetical protein [Clostridium thermarum]|uniref:hypothetical protein n=1 Tax=Clostridium thermarum TaxID=1716543 RepID=UPI00111F1CE2|nr:hypothetical protein [Clostridium thermarum]
MSFKKVIKIYNSNIETIKSELGKRCRGSFVFIYYEEDIYIDTLYIPATKTKWLSKMIKNHMIYNFDDISKLCYSYNILSKSSNKYKIRLYCINSKKEQLFEALNKGAKVKGVYLIQFCYLYYVEKILKKSEFVLIFTSGEFTYLVFYAGGGVESSSIFKFADNGSGNLLDIIKKCIGCGDKITTDINFPIVFLNYHSKGHIECLAEHFSVKDLGKISEDKIIKKYIGVI